MTTASAARPRATRARVRAAVHDRRGADVADGPPAGRGQHELKLTVPPASHRDTIQGLPIDPVESQPRQVYFFDTPDLALNRAGLVVRARRIQGGKGDTVIKLRPVDPADLSPDMRADASFNVEVDVLPGGYVCSASFKGRSDGAQIWDAVRGGRPLRKLFSKPQRAFFQQHAPTASTRRAPPARADVLPEGQVRRPTGRGGPTAIRPIVVEMWLYPDGSRILELSTKCAPPRPSTSRPKRARTLPGAGSCSPASSRPRRERRSSTTPSSWRRRPAEGDLTGAQLGARSRGFGCGDS